MDQDTIFLSATSVEEAYSLEERQMRNICIGPCGSMVDESVYTEILKEGKIKVGRCGTKCQERGEREFGEKKHAQNQRIWIINHLSTDTK